MTALPIATSFPARKTLRARLMSIPPSSFQMAQRFGMADWPMATMKLSS